MQGFLQVDLSDDEIGMIVDTLVYDTLVDRVPQVSATPFSWACWSFMHVLFSSFRLDQHTLNDPRLQRPSPQRLLKQSVTCGRRVAPIASAAHCTTLQQARHSPTSLAESARCAEYASVRTKIPCVPQTHCLHLCNNETQRSAVMQPIKPVCAPFMCHLRIGSTTGSDFTFAVR